MYSNYKGNDAQGCCLSLAVVPLPWPVRKSPGVFDYFPGSSRDCQHREAVMLRTDHEAESTGCLKSIARSTAS
jgi:hypothetical protein